MKALFFSDLDGTLTDHNTYSYDLSAKGINLLQENSIPLIPVSSKTFNEIFLLMRKLYLNAPFAFENGSGIAYPSLRGYHTELTGPGVEKLLEFFPELEKISGKSLRNIISLTDAEIAHITGLKPESSALTKKRMVTLPFIVQGEHLLPDNEIFRLNLQLQEYNLCITKGGRFNHLGPACSGKGFAVKKIIEFYRDKYKDEIITAAAGDSLNDISMFENVDYPYIIRKYDGSIIHFAKGKIMKSSGPAGFSEAVNDFLTIIAG